MLKISSDQGVKRTLLHLSAADEGVCTMREVIYICRVLIPAILFIGGLLPWIAGCGQQTTGGAQTVLVTVGDRVATKEDFTNALERAKLAYSWESLKDAERFVEICRWVLEQMIEEMILLEASDELGVSVSDSELDEAAAAITKDFPDGVFSQLLLENAISEPEWRQRLRVRLLMKKTVQALIPQTVEIGEDEIAEYVKQLAEKGEMPAETGPEADDDHQRIIERLREKKRGDAMEALLGQRREKTPPVVNEAEWRKLLVKLTP